MQWIRNRIKEESAGAMVENVIVLPLVFIIIFFMLLASFMIHDRATIESAAKRGAIYAANCISNPNYANIVGNGGDMDPTAKKTFSFSGIGKNVKAYRAFTGGMDVTGIVETQVRNIVNKTRIPWLPQESVKVDCTQKNMFLYQDVTVTVTATYKLPAFFKIVGLETEYEYKATAKTRTTDPDEFIRNADLIVDLIHDIDDKTGGHIEKVKNTISKMATSLLDWLGTDKKNEK